MKCPSCGQTIRIKKNGAVSFHRIPVKVRRHLFGWNAILGAYCAFSGCSYMPESQEMPQQFYSSLT